MLSGPSGVGKDAVLSRMREENIPYHFTVTATTRPRRTNETEGVDYIFLSNESFHQMIRNEALLEWAEVYGHFYGVPKAPIVNAITKGQDVIIKIDVQGADTIRELAPDTLSIFLAPPSIAALANRLRLRRTEAPEVLQLRLRKAEAEMRDASKFDYIVTNHQDRISDTVQEIEEIVARERHRSPNRKIVL